MKGVTPLLELLCDLDNFVLFCYCLKKSKETKQQMAIAKKNSSVKKYKFCHIKNKTTQLKFLAYNNLSKTQIMQPLINLIDKKKTILLASIVPERKANKNNSEIKQIKCHIIIITTFFLEKKKQSQTTII
ncbi:hypothetical protein RFI_04828 [Reticulomyxa filosa]|uniref:Uncharacterized protein n=1 Tax=Reticulomyxa filosa TaxID=46433 RepID=X6P2C5_RETFI|nr:hypothetical protein RFI_04828 [Reticulomyxa filosa]|eukprot:ETO32288.1 hypothetical protein RFI_04828 [Reticulomyxa filosa]